MKRILVIALSVIIISSCSEPSLQKTIIHFTDTIAVAYGDTAGLNWQLVKAVYSVDTMWAYGDKSLAEGKFKIDTAKWKFFIVRDTMRDVNKKPIFDSVSKTWKPFYDWYELTDKEKSGIKIVPLAKIKSGK
jgi:hypothetical protein